MRCRLANLTIRGSTFRRGIIASGVEPGAIMSPSLLTATPTITGFSSGIATGAGTGTAAGAGAWTCGANSFTGSIRACLVSLPTSIGMIGVYLLGPSDVRELDLRRRSADILPTSKLKFVRRFSFSITGLRSDSNPPGFWTRPQHVHLEYDGTEDVIEDESESVTPGASISLSLPFLLEVVGEESDSSGNDRWVSWLSGRTAGCCPYSVS